MNGEAPRQDWTSDTSPQDGRTIMSIWRTKQGLRPRDDIVVSPYMKQSIDEFDLV